MNRDKEILNALVVEFIGTPEHTEEGVVVKAEHVQKIGTLMLTLYGAYFPHEDLEYILDDINNMVKAEWKEMLPPIVH